MMISLDNLAHHYGVLPSEALSRCTTFDFAVLDTATRWKNYQYEKQSKGEKDKKDYSQKELMDMWRAVKGDDNADSKK
jgi:hypothetical protein